MTDTSGKRSYGFVVIIYDVASDLHVREVMETLEEYGAKIPDEGHYNGTIVQESNFCDEIPVLRDRVSNPKCMGDLIRQRIKPDRVFVPRAIGLLSQWCWNDLLISWLLLLSDIFKNSGDPLAPLERYLVNVISEIPLPPLDETETRIAIGGKNLYFSLPAPADPQRLKNFSLYPLFRTLSAQNVITALELILLERKVLFVSRTLALLSSCIYSLLYLIYPFVWSHILVPVLPKCLLQHIEAPVPFIIGVGSQYCCPDVFNDKISFPDLCIVHLDSNKITIRGPYIPLPPGCRDTLRRDIRAAIPRFLQCDDSFPQKMHGPPKSYHRIDDTSTFYNKAHSSSYDARVCTSVPGFYSQCSITKHQKIQKYEQNQEATSGAQRLPSLKSTDSRHGSPAPSSLGSLASTPVSYQGPTHTKNASTLYSSASSTSKPFSPSTAVAPITPSLYSHSPQNINSIDVGTYHYPAGAEYQDLFPHEKQLCEEFCSIALNPDHVRGYTPNIDHRVVSRSRVPTRRFHEGHELLQLHVRDICACDKIIRGRRPLYPQEERKFSMERSSKSKRSCLYMSDIDDINGLYNTMADQEAIYSQEPRSCKFNDGNAYYLESALRRMNCHLCERPHAEVACALCQKYIVMNPNRSEEYLNGKGGNDQVAAVEYYCILCCNHFHPKCVGSLDDFPCPKTFDEKSIQAAVLKALMGILKNVKSHIVFPDKSSRNSNILTPGSFMLGDYFKKAQFEGSFDKDARPFVKHLIGTQAFASFVLLRVKNHPYRECFVLSDKTNRQQTNTRITKSLSMFKSPHDVCYNPGGLPFPHRCRLTDTLEINTEGLGDNLVFVDPEIGLPDKLDESLISKPRPIHSYITDRDIEYLTNDGVIRETGLLRADPINWMKSKFQNMGKSQASRRNSVPNPRLRSPSFTKQKLKSIEAILSKYNSVDLEVFSEFELREMLETLKKQNDALQQLSGGCFQAIEDDPGGFKETLSRLLQMIVICEDRIAAIES